jgi:glycosyltransferase involved in cell wall biosynthesis
VTTNVGGIPTIVSNGVTGISLPAETPASDFGCAILELFCNPCRYEAMALASYGDFEARLNWKVFGDRCMKILRQVLA